MTSAEMVPFVEGLVAGLAAIPVLTALFKGGSVSVEDEEAVVITRFGKREAVLTQPGLHVVPGKLMPWVETRRVSLARDFRHFEGLHVSDVRGTTMVVDLWLELRIVDPVKALFEVADWDRSLRTLVTNVAIAQLGEREFAQILPDRSELGERLQREIAAETARWGIQVEKVFLRNVKLLPEVSRQLFARVSARLEQAKATTEENGRVQVARLEAQTREQIAGLVAEAKSEYPTAVGRALAELRPTPRVLEAYMQLYELSLVRPQRTVAFSGFGEGDLRAIDAAMLPAATDLPAPANGAAVHTKN